jgi:transposase
VRFIDIVSISWYETCAIKLEIKARLKWIELYKETRNAGLVCRRCGISRPTLRKWFRRYEESGIEGLYNKSRRPLRSPNKKVTAEQERLILDFRKKRKLGARRIQNELIWNHQLSLSLATIHKILTRHNFKPLKRQHLSSIINSTRELFLEIASSLIPAF